MHACITGAPGDRNPRQGRLRSIERRPVEPAFAVSGSMEFGGRGERPQSANGR